MRMNARCGTMAGCTGLTVLALGVAGSAMMPVGPAAAPTTADASPWLILSWQDQDDQPTQQQQQGNEARRYQPARKARMLETDIADGAVQAETAEPQDSPDNAASEAAGVEEVVETVNLVVEFVRPSENAPIVVRINGQQVDPRTGYLIRRIVAGHLGHPISDGRGDGPPWRDGPPQGASGGQRHPDFGGQGEPGMQGQGNGRGGPPNGRIRPNALGNGQARDTQPNNRQGGGNGRPFTFRPVGDDDTPLFIEPEELTSDLIATVMTVVRDYDSPDTYRRLEDMQLESDDESFNRELRRVMLRWQPEIELYRGDRTAYDLRLQDTKYSSRTFELVMKYRQARIRKDDLSTQIIADEMRQLVGEHFDIRQQQREHEYRKLADDLGVLRQRIDQRLERRDEIIEAQLSRMMTDPMDF